MTSSTGIQKSVVADFLLGRQPAPKLWHGDLLFVMNAQPYLCSNLNLFLFIYNSSQSSLPSFLNILLSCCLHGWLVAACLLSPGVFLSFFLVLNFFLSSLEPRFLLLFILFCLPVLLIPLLPSYWSFSSSLDQSGALGRQGETVTHLYIIKQMQQKQM